MEWKLRDRITLSHVFNYRGTGPASSPVAPPRFGIALRTRAQLPRVALQEPGKKRLWRRQARDSFAQDTESAHRHNKT